MMKLNKPRLLPLTIAGMATLLTVKCAGIVLAAAPAAEPASAARSSAPARPLAPATPAAAPAKESCAAPSEAEQRLLSDLRHRRDELDAREAAMRGRESVIEAAGRKLDQRVAELKALQAHLEQLDAARRQKNDAEWLGLVTLYEKMKPRDAARIFDELEMPVLVRLVDRMKEAKAAAILAAMLPDKAREATTELATLREHRGAATAPAPTKTN